MFAIDDINGNIVPDLSQSRARDIISKKAGKEISEQLSRAKQEYERASIIRDNANYACSIHRKNHPDDMETLVDLRKKWQDLDSVACQKYSAFLRAEQDSLKYDYENQEPYNYSPVHKIECCHCAKIFYSKNYRKMYCGYYCAEKVYFQRRKDRHHKKLEGRECPLCKMKFKANRMNMVYCSKACKQKAYRKRKS